MAAAISATPGANEVPAPYTEDFPHRYLNKSVDQVVHEIVNDPYAPSFNNTKRAWHVLGVKMDAGRPMRNDFLTWINNLWIFLHHDTTLKGRRARAYVLDALKTLKFSNPYWNVDYKDPNGGLIISGIVGVEWHGVWSHSDTGDRAAKNPNGIYRRAWNRLPAPNNGSYGEADGRQYYKQYSAPFPEGEQLGRQRMERDLDLWKYYHAFQGFVVSGGGADWFFRAVKVPPGPNSLWASVSYFVQTRTQIGTGNNIFRHWLVKARIWTWFMQVLADDEHPRWADYHWLQLQSETYRQPWGFLSLARSLFAGKNQGLAAYSPKEIFYVIADYFHTQVIVFHWDDLKRGPQKHHDSAIDPQRWQGGARYRAKIFGFLDPTRRQILLHTHDWLHFSPVDYDLPPSLHGRIGYHPNNDPNFVGGDLLNPPPAGWTLPPVPEKQFGHNGGADGEGPPLEGPIDADWWTPHPDLEERKFLRDANNGGAPPYLQARYNYFRPGEQEALEAYYGLPVPELDGDPPLEVIDHSGWDFTYASRQTVGRLSYKTDEQSPVPAHVRKWFPDRFVRARFEAGSDIPGRMFKLPTRRQIARWSLTTENGELPSNAEFREVVQPHQDEDGAQWRFGIDPMGVVPDDQIPGPNKPKLPRHWDPAADKRLDGWMTENGQIGQTRNNGKGLMEDPWWEFDEHFGMGLWGPLL